MYLVPDFKIDDLQVYDLQLRPCVGRGGCLSLGCYNKNTINWVVCKQREFISHSSGGWKSRIRVPAWSALVRV